MSKAKFQVAYDGPALAEHGMDVYELAPALLAFGDLIREANAQLNHEKTKVSVVVTEDFEHRCFNINFEVLQTLLEQTRSLLSDDDVKSAKDILEWLGIISAPIVGGVGLMRYLRRRKGRPIKSLTKIEDADQTGAVSIVFEGDKNDVTVNQHIFEMGENPKIRNATSRALEPLKREGVDEVRFQQHEHLVESFSKQDADDIRLSCAPQVGEDEVFEPQTVTAHLKVHAPVFDADAARWRFEYGGRPIYADISETDIAEATIERGYVAIGDVYRVRLEVTEHRTPTGFRNEYKILEVLDFIPAGPDFQLTFEAQLGPPEEQ